MDPEVRKRLGWIRVYEESRNAGVACLRCGISRPTLRKWWRRYESDGIKGLESRSRRPLGMPFQKVFSGEIKKIHRLRQRIWGTSYSVRVDPA